MDQLRTLLAVREAGSALGAARMLGRGQSSVQKQLDTMNRTYGELCGEPLVRKRGRGESVLFTATGAALVEVARGTLDGWAEGAERCRRRFGDRLAVGSTRYTLGFLLNAVERVTDAFRSGGVRLTVAHVRTAELLGRLDSHDLDLVCGSTLTTGPGDERLARYEVLEWRRSGLALVTNLSERRLPGPTVAVSELPGLPLAVSSDGLIAGFLRGWFGGRHREELRIAADIDTLPYGLELLTSRVLSGCLLVTQGIGEALAEGWLPEENLQPAPEGAPRPPAGGGLRTLELVDDVSSGLAVLSGAFVRAGERTALPSGHPLNLLWDGLRREHARHQGA
ncbi:LysR family transcriptional regulator [Streptomyces palmae]|uniref:LysR family transcriptional regulator n=2 Tax=Streptomyces palmae TaxID=1701085 RepID=A0A4Z0HEH9_9ACTN|nr:LysR family transcriptional regulator [Streptomyces palmae]